MVSSDSYFHMYDVHILHTCRSTYLYVWHLHITHMQIPMFMWVCGMIVCDDSIFTTRHTYIIDVQIPMFTCMTFMMYTHKQTGGAAARRRFCEYKPPCASFNFWSWKVSLSTWKVPSNVSLFISCVWWNTHSRDTKDLCLLGESHETLSLFETLTLVRHSLLGDTHETQQTCFSLHLMFLPLLMNHEYVPTS